MTTEQMGGGGATTPPNVAALVDAIDARARQAGNEGATTVVQRLLGSVTEVLTGIQDRLDHVEDALTSSSGGGGGGGGGAVVEAVQSGLASFNARLARLEEAFVQAVDESGSGTQAVVDEVRTVVTRALASSPLPAGGGELDPATRDALTRVESALSGLAAAREERPAQEVIGLALAAMGERLDALEARLVAAVQSLPLPVAASQEDVKVDLSTLDLTSSLGPVLDRMDATEARVAEAATAMLSPVLDRLDHVERRLMESPREVTSSIEAAFEVVQVRIAGLEQLLRGRVTERVDPTSGIRAALAPVVERMDELDASHRSTAARHHEGIGRVEAALAALPGRFTSLEERVWAVVSSLTDGAVGAPVDATLLGRLEEAVDRLDRDEASARLVKLVEERLSAGLRAVTERTDEVRRAVDQLAKSAEVPSSDDGALDDVVASLRALQTATRSVPDELADALGARLVPMGDRLSGLDGRLDALQELVSRVATSGPDPTEALAELAAGMRAVRTATESASSGPDHSEAIAELADALRAVRREVQQLASRPVTAEAAGPDHTEAIAELADALRAVRLEVQELAARPNTADGAATPVRTESFPQLAASLVEQINGAARREAELLTQRVAALAVGVEASRVLLEQHLQETENSIGRKAGEVTRRLAADFGIKSRRTTGPGGRRDPRELGSG